MTHWMVLEHTDIGWIQMEENEDDGGEDNGWLYPTKELADARVALSRHDYPGLVYVAVEVDLPDLGGGNND